MVDLAIRHRFTVDEFHRMGEVGILAEGDRLELVNGEIVEMTPIGSAHATCVRDLDEWLQPLLRGEAVVSAQQPLTVEFDGEPIPDITMVSSTIASTRFMSGPPSITTMRRHTDSS